MVAKVYAVNWRVVLAIDLGLFNLGIVAFALLPTSTIIGQEIALAALALVSLVMVCRHAIAPCSSWYRFGYLLSGAVGLLTFLAFETADTDAPIFVKVSTGLFLLAGVASGYSAHLVDGGKRELA